MSTQSLQSLIIRDIKEISEMREVEQVQKDVWGVADREVFPALALVPMIELGAVLVGAFDGGRMAGFVFGFPGYESGRVILHSDMLAVRPAYRAYGLGYKLKLAQRERALANGIDTITWTFDPLQSLNAHLNFGKLGVIADRYHVNYYGETTSFLHRAGPDRLWVTWLLNSERVKDRIAGASAATPDLSRIPAVVRVGEDDGPVINASEKLGRQSLTVEIPYNINMMLKESDELAVHWREATREVFTRMMAAGFVVEEFYRRERNKIKIGVYMLRAGKAAT